MNKQMAFGVLLVGIGVAAMASDRSLWLFAIGLFDVTAGALWVGAATKR